MKILILSCNTGEGHNAAGKAIREAAIRCGHTADMLDMFLLSGKKTSHAVGGAYVELVKHMPHAFGMLYKIGMAISSNKHKSPVYYANALMAKKLAACLSQHDYDIIVPPPLYPAETLTYMKKKGMLQIPAAAIGTDYTCIPFWEETDLDAYFLPHEDCVSEYVHRGIPADRLYPYGIPVSGAFSPAEDRILAKMHARNALNLPQGVPICLVMSGSMGFGKVHLLAHELVSRLENGEQAVIICGNNKKRMRSLRLQFHKNPNVHIIGFTRHVAEYMAAADVLFTKPGGLSSTEAAVRRVPLVHTDPIPGCETKNRAFFVSRGMSVTGAHQKELAEAGISLARDDARQIAMLDAQHQNSHPQAGTAITHLLEKLVSE